MFLIVQLWFLSQRICMEKGSGDLVSGSAVVMLEYIPCSYDLCVIWVTIQLSLKVSQFFVWLPTLVALISLVTMKTHQPIKSYESEFIIMKFLSIIPGTSITFPNLFLWSHSNRQLLILRFNKYWKLILRAKETVFFYFFFCQRHTKKPLHWTVDW